MSVAINITFFITASLVLVLSGSFLVRSLIKISSFLKISEYVAAFVIMAASTSIPELFVGIQSAVTGKPVISLGNVIGSNVANVTLILGIAVLIARGINAKRKVARKDSWYMFLIALLPIVLMVLGNGLSRTDGLILISVFVIYVYILLKQRSAYTKILKERVGRWEIIVYLMVFIASLATLFYSSEFVVRYGSLLAINLNFPDMFIGLFFVALGTSLPELVFSAKSIQLGRNDLVLGNLIGSVVFNSTLVLGVTALISPIANSLSYFLVSAAFMLVALFLFITFVESGSKITLNEGVSLILFYVLFLLVDLSIKGFF